ncbi:MAG: agmatine deiminase family protein [Bacteroidales bacterium]|nr:agmatine deiminase family protein [Bacteroidales bacterium]
MRKIFILALALITMGSAMAQEPTRTRDEMRQYLLKTKHKRDFSQQYKNSNIPLAPATQETKNGSKSAGLQLPANNWFPGEWEEVKAIVVTPYYDHLVPGHENNGSWFADPVVTGYADYYYGSYQNQQGGGPYISVIDTSNQTFSNVFYYLMDAIQLGGAEAWVRIENASDSGAVLRKLARMNLRSDNVKFIVGPGNSFWFRDCGPICFYYGDQDSVGMVDFMYYPGRALDDSLPSLIEEQMGIPNYITTIEWEGGNCVVDGTGMVLSSDAIYSGNADTYGQISWDGTNTSTINYQSKSPLTHAQVKDSLAHILGPRGAHILPAFKYDGGTGHVDLYCDMWDENEFIFSKFPAYCSNWTDAKTAAKNIDSLCSYTSLFGKNYKCHYIPFPCANNGANFSSQSQYDNYFTRTYSNHTFVNNVIIQPCFSNVVNGQPSSEWDRLRIDSVRMAYPGYTIYPINVASFDGSGGAIHCITKQIPADNPVRILHPSITGNTEDMYTSTDAPITATITNKSGIQSAKVVYRIAGGQWQEVALTPGSDNSFTGSIATSGQLSGSDTKVEYYISATSNNGKTITKPMTASQGGYYTFYLGHNDNVGIDNVEAQNFGQFYPNPANGIANIDITLGNEANYEVSIVDEMGRMVHRSDLKASGSIVYSIATEKLGTGVYHVVFQSKDERIVRRLIVK